MSRVTNQLAIRHIKITYKVFDCLYIHYKILTLIYNIMDFWKPSKY
jgi:hypothetical protein